jgi:hypothetical protein
MIYALCMRIKKSWKKISKDFKKRKSWQRTDINDGGGGIWFYVTNSRQSRICVFSPEDEDIRFRRNIGIC